MWYSLRRFLYPLEMPIKDKIHTICREIYGADGVEYSELAETRIAVSTILTLHFASHLS